MDTFGKKLREAREARDFSQAELAKQIGSYHSIIGKYERNEIKPSIETAKNIADSLEVTLDYLLGGSNSAVLDKELLKRLEDIESLTKEDKDKIYYFIDMAVRDAKARQAYK